MYKNKKIYVAPMMQYTDKHDRYFLRIISKNVILFTEMIPANAIIYGNKKKLLEYNQNEHPIILQVGGSNPKDISQCALIAKNQFKYDGFNINVGCPSRKVENGKFGACLMNEPEIVGKCIKEIKKITNIQVSVKCRIGLGEKQNYFFLKKFISSVSKSGCKLFFIHARNAVLSKFNPKKNRTIPSLNYEFVYKIKKDFPNLEIIINGGVNNIYSIKHHLKFVDGVMIGREIYKNPFFLKQIEEEIFNNKNITTRKQVLEKLIPYIKNEMEKNKASIQSITRHTFGLFTGIKGSKRWKQYLNNIKFMKGNIKDIILNGIKNINE
jgi:tRNA-dihydrouridine synthase A